MAPISKILFVVPLPPPLAGVEQMSQTLLESGIKDRFDIRVLRSNIRDSNKEKGHWDFKGIIRVLRISLNLVLKILSIRPNIVYLTISQNTSGLCRDCLYIGICSLTGRPIVGHLHGGMLAQYLSSRSVMGRQFFLFFLRRINRLIVLSRSAKSSLEPFIQPDRIVVIHNAIRPFQSGKKSNNNSGGLKVGFMGHLSVAKGYFDLLAVADRFLKEGKKVRFMFAGERVASEQNIPSSFLSQNNTIGSWERVDRLLKAHPDALVHKGIITGSDKTAFFNELDVFVLPSYSESFPLAVLEAAHVGLPLVITRVGVLPEILAEPKNGFFIEPGDCEGLYRAINKFLGESNLGKTMGQANKEWSKRYEIEGRVDEFAAVFQSILG